jgi:hypothetical protein
VTIYFVRSDCGRIKIGYTAAETPTGRVSSLQTSSPRKLEVLAYCPGDEHREGILHYHLRSARVQGEWFKPTAKVASLLAFVKQFGTTDGWTDAHESPDQWAAYVTTFGHLDGFRALRGVPEHQAAWQRALARKQPFVTIEPESFEWADIYSVWRAEVDTWGPDVEVSREICAEFPDELTACGWATSDGRDWDGSGGRGIFAASLLNNQGDSEARAAIWISACIKTLAGRHSSELHYLTKRVPAVRELTNVIAKRSWPWNRMSTLVLPRAMRLPERCLLDTWEFIQACAQHRAAVLSGHCITTRLSLKAWAARGKERAA